MHYGARLGLPMVEEGARDTPPGAKIGAARRAHSLCRHYPFTINHMVHYGLPEIPCPDRPYPITINTQLPLIIWVVQTGGSRSVLD